MACLKTSGFQRELRPWRLGFLCHLRCRLMLTYLAHFSDYAVIRPSVITLNDSLNCGALCDAEGGTPPLESEFSRPGLTRLPSEGPKLRSLTLWHSVLIATHRVLPASGRPRCDIPD